MKKKPLLSINSDNLKRIIKFKGYKISDLGKEDLLSVSRQTINTWLHGNKIPPKKLSILAKKLQLTSNEIDSILMSVEKGGTSMIKKADRFNSSKVEFDDLPLLGLVEVARVGSYGRRKYAKHNWRGEAPTSQYLNCALRHIFKYMYGEIHDGESSFKHIAHAAWNLLTLLEKEALGEDVKDLYHKESKIDLEKYFKV